jgi:hypothetical protein
MTAPAPPRSRTEPPAGIWPYTRPPVLNPTGGGRLSSAERLRGGRGTKAPLPSQSDTPASSSVFYEAPGFNARLAWTDRSDCLQELNYADPRLDTYWEGRA